MSAPSLETDRLRLRAFTSDDWRGLQAYVADDEVMRYDRPWPKSDGELREAATYLAEHTGYWAVCLRATGQLIGHVTCTESEPHAFRNWDLGFGFNPEFQHQGYALEAADRVLRFVFEEGGARRVVASCHPKNAPAWRLLERLGMRREAHHVQPGFLRRTAEDEPIWTDAYEYALLAEEWHSQHLAG
jgi:ribosomal-protein-alanine N-acetyltransferase